MQLLLFKRQLNEQVTLDSGKPGRIVEIARASQPDHWYHNDDPLPVGTLLYRVQSDIESWSWEIDETLRPG